MPSITSLIDQIKNNQIATVDLSGLALSDTQYADLATALSTNISVRKLIVRAPNNIMSASGLQSIANLFKTNNYIETLDLFYLKIGDASMAYFASALQYNNGLKSIELTNVGLTDAGVITLAAALKVNNGLETISLADNSISPNGIAALSDGLKNNTKLAVINLRNSQIGDAGAIALADMLKTNRAVKLLILNRTGIGDIGATALASVLSINPIFQQLWLASNSIGDEGAIAFATALKGNKSFLGLDFSGNQITDRGAVAMADTLKTNTALLGVLLGNNSLTNVAAFAIAESLKMNTGVLQAVTIENNSIDDTGYATIARALSNNMYIKKLSFANPETYGNYTDIITGLLSRNRQCHNELAPGLTCPVLHLNPFSVQNGGRITLNSDSITLTNLSSFYYYSEDSSTPYVVGSLTNGTILWGNFTATQVTHGQFLNIASQVITQFTQAQINASAVFFQHDGSGIAPSFNVTASYNDLETWPIPAVINFTLVPMTSSTTPTPTSTMMPLTSTTTSRPFTTTRLASTPFTTPSTSATLTTQLTSTPFTTSTSSSLPSAASTFFSTSTPTTMGAATSIVGNSVAGNNYSNPAASIGAAFAGGAALLGAVAGLVWWRRRQRQHFILQPIPRQPTPPPIFIPPPTPPPLIVAPQSPVAPPTYLLPDDVRDVRAGIVRDLNMGWIPNGNNELLIRGLLRRAQQRPHLNLCVKLFHLLGTEDAAWFGTLSQNQFDTYNALKRKLLSHIDKWTQPISDVLIRSTHFNSGIRDDDALCQTYTALYATADLKPLFDLARLACLGLHNLSRMRVTEDGYDSDHNHETFARIHSSKFSIVVDPTAATVQQIHLSGADGQGGAGAHGIYERGSNTIYLGSARAALEARGTFVHELTHFVAEEVYGNACKPYPPVSAAGVKTDKQNRFEAIRQNLYQYRNSQQLSTILRSAFSYSPHQYDTELIVRVPQMIVRGENFSAENGSEQLRNYYLNIFLPDVRAHIEKLTKRAFGGINPEIILSRHEGPVTIAELAEQASLPGVLDQRLYETDSDL